MKQKLLSLGQDFTIEDEEGNAVYKVDGRAISFGGRDRPYLRFGRIATGRLISLSCMCGWRKQPIFSFSGS